MSDIKSLTDRLESALATLGSANSGASAEDLETAKENLASALEEKDALKQKLTEAEAAQNSAAGQIKSLEDEVASLKSEIANAASAPAGDVPEDLTQLRADREEDLKKVNDILTKLKPLVEG